MFRKRIDLAVRGRFVAVARPGAREPADASDATIAGHGDRAGPGAGKSCPARGSSRARPHAHGAQTAGRAAAAAVAFGALASGADTAVDARGRTGPASGPSAGAR